MGAFRIWLLVTLDNDWIWQSALLDKHQAARSSSHYMNKKQEQTSWAQGKNGGRFKNVVKKNEAKIFKRTFKALKSIREVKLFTKNCGLLSSLLWYK